MGDDESGVNDGWKKDIMPKNGRERSVVGELLDWNMSRKTKKLQSTRQVGKDKVSRRCGVADLYVFFNLDGLHCNRVGLDNEVG